MAKTELILNLAWMLLCVGALSAQVWRDRLRCGAHKPGIRWRRTLSVMISALALFPVISASDDRIRLADLDAAPPAQQASLERGQIHNLLTTTPLEDPEHGQTPEPFLLTAIVCLFLIARPEIAALARWLAISAVGRAPPAFA